MEEKRKYTNAEVKGYIESVKREYELTFARQRERIDELRSALEAAEKKNAEYESQKGLVYKAITSALKKADDIERVSLIKYNQEIAQLKSFHDKWVGYFNKIIAKYPLEDELVAASKVSGKIADVLSKASDVEQQYVQERERLRESIDSEEPEFAESVTSSFDDSEVAANVADDEYTDRSPAGFSFAEALHPKQDLKDIMKELGVLIDD